jgi:hypothetical protein
MFDPIDENDPRLVFVPIEQLAESPGGIVEHIMDCWWQVHPDPTKGAVFWNPRPDKYVIGYGIPECDNEKSAAEKRHQKYPWAEIRFIPDVYCPVNERDYT